MSILGKWFKKDKEERLGKQTDVEVGASSAKESTAETVVEKKQASKKTTAKSSEKNDSKKEKDLVSSVITPAPNHMSHIIKRLHVTEKAAAAEERSVYTFVVDNKTTKNEVAKEIHRAYKVKPEKVRMMNMRGKVVRWGRHTGKRSNWKKAIVYLKKGDKISLHEGT